jgi:hypothetical protein
MMTAEIVGQHLHDISAALESPNEFSCINGKYAHAASQDMHHLFIQLIASGN